MFLNIFLNKSILQNFGIKNIIYFFLKGKGIAKYIFIGIFTNEKIDPPFAIKIKIDKIHLVLY